MSLTFGSLVARPTFFRPRRHDKPQPRQEQPRREERFELPKPTLAPPAGMGIFDDSAPVRTTSVKPVESKPALPMLPPKQLLVTLFRGYGPGHGTGTLLIHRMGVDRWDVVSAFVPINPRAIQDWPVARSRHYNSYCGHEKKDWDLRLPSIPKVDAKFNQLPQMSDLERACYQGYEMLEIASSVVSAPKYRVRGLDQSIISNWLPFTSDVRAKLAFGQNHAQKHHLDKFLSARLVEISKETVNLLPPPRQIEAKLEAATSVFQAPADAVPTPRPTYKPSVIDLRNDWSYTLPVIEAKKPVQRVSVFRSKGPAKRRTLRNVEHFADLYKYVLTGLKPWQHKHKPKMATARHDRFQRKPVVQAAKPGPTRVDRSAIQVEKQPEFDPQYRRVMGGSDAAFTRSDVQPAYDPRAVQGMGAELPPVTLPRARVLSA
jgi:hypothetical protein